MTYTQTQLHSDVTTHAAVADGAALHEDDGDLAVAAFRGAHERSAQLLVGDVRRRASLPGRDV